MSFVEYEKPPVVEVVCGVTFTALEKLTVPYIGKLWELFPDYPDVQEAPPLAPVFEAFSTSPSPLVVNNLVFQAPRVWFQNTAGNHLIQVQRDRFLVNWKRTSEEHPYPRYPAVVGAFEEKLDIFKQFVDSTLAQQVQAKQFELSYINHVPASAEAWQDLSDLGVVLPDLAWRNAPRFLPAPERVNCQLAFPLPNQAGRLHLKVQHGVRQLDGSPVLLVDLTARGFGEDQRAWFDLAHEWVVKGFTDLTGEKLQRDLWGRTK